MTTCVARASAAKRLTPSVTRSAGIVAVSAPRLEARASVAPSRARSAGPSRALRRVSTWSAVQRAPQRVGQPLGGADQFGRARQLADRDKDPLARRIRPGERLGAQLGEHPRVDRLRGAAQRELAQCGQVRPAEEMAKGARRLLGDIDLARLQPRDQLVGWQVDDLDLGVLEHPVGHGLADAYPSKAGDGVVQRFDVLDVDRGEDVDARRQQLVDVHEALRVARARRVGVGELVDQREARPAGEEGVDVHLGERRPIGVDDPPRDDLERPDERLGLGPAVRLDEADDDVGPFTQAHRGVGQHLVGLADAGRCTEEHLEPAAPFGVGHGEKGFGLGAVAVAHGAGCAPTRSSCRLSCRTLTRGSPRTAPSGVWTAASTIALTTPSAMPRARATRATWA